MADNPDMNALTDNLMYARARGRSLWAQVLDIFRLATARRGMGADDYYWFALYDDRWTDQERARMIGDAWAPEMIARTARSDWWAVGKDKILNYLLLEAYGFQVPTVRAIYHPHRPYPRAEHLRSQEQLEAWLRTACPYPQFAKPVTGLQSKGQALLLGYDADSDTLSRQGDPPIPVAEYAAAVAKMEGLTVDDGFLFQDLIPPDPRLEPLIGRRLSGVRVVVVLEDSGPRAIHAVWKVPVGANYADNYWRPGNLAADIDLATGEVKRIVTGWGTDLQEVTRHPDTEAVLLGQTIPDWDRVVDLAVRGSVTMPKILLQGWDVGLCEGGPRVIEANLGTGFRLPQLVTRTGFLTPDFDRFLTWATAKIRAEGTGDLA